MIQRNETVTSSDALHVCIYCVLEQFRHRGGDFVKQLGMLWWKADPINKQKILHTFGDYFREYADVVLATKSRCSHK